MTEANRPPVAEARTSGKRTVPWLGLSRPAIDATMVVLDAPSPRPVARQQIASGTPRREGGAWRLEEAAAVIDAFMAAAPAIAFVKDSDGRYLHANRQFLEQFGQRSGSDWLGTTDADIWPADIAARFRADDAAALAADAPVTTTRLMPVGETRVPFLVTKFPIHTPEGVLIGGIGLDISEQVRTNDELRRNEALLETAVHFGGFAAWKLDRTVRPADEPAESWQILGFGRGTPSLDREALIRLVHPDDRDRVVASVTAALQEGQPLDIEFRIIGSDGMERWIQGTARLVPGEAGPARLVGMTRDITDERAATAFLRSQATILENVQDAIVVTDAVGRVTYWNDPAARIFGYTADEALGRPLRDFHPTLQAAGAGRDGGLPPDGEFDGELQGRLPRHGAPADPPHARS